MDMRINGLKAEWLIILILLAVIGWQRACTGTKKCKPCKNCVVTRDTVLVFPEDTTPVKVTSDNYKPKPKKKIPAKPENYETFNFSGAALPCDSLAVADYYNSYIYNDTVYNNDSTIVVTINDSLSQNIIQRREVFIQNRKPLAVITPTLVTPAAKKRIVINAGLMLGTNLQRYNIEPTVAIQTKRDDIIIGGVDILGQPAIYKVGYLIKLSFRRTDR